MVRRSNHKEQIKMILKMVIGLILLSAILPLQEVFGAPPALPPRPELSSPPANVQGLEPKERLEKLEELSGRVHATSTPSRTGLQGVVVISGTVTSGYGDSYLEPIMK